MSYTHLIQHERYQIQCWTAEGLAFGKLPADCSGIRARSVESYGGMS